MGLPQQEFVSSRSRSVLNLLLSLIFVVIGVATWRDTDWVLRSGLIFFSFCAAIFVLLSLRPQRLKLDDEGLTLSGGLLLSAQKIRWHDISEFQVRRLHPGSRMVTFTYSSNVSLPIRRGLGRSGAIAGKWPGGPEAMVQRLNDYKDKTRS